MIRQSGKQPHKQGNNGAVNLAQLAAKQRIVAYQSLCRPIFSPSPRDRANWSWILGGGVILEPEKAGGVAGRRSYGKCRLKVFYKALVIDIR